MRPIAYIYGSKNQGGITLRKCRTEQPDPGPEEMAAGCAEYFAQCDALGRRPTWQGLAGYLNMTSEALTARLRDGKGDEAGVILRKAADAISDRLQQRTDSMAVLSVKQPIYGGFLDRAQGAGDGAVSIKVTVGGKGGKETKEFGK